ncbi:hypothetical protein CISG_07822 [Coccidioides immitis RMSCC 3703]|uniref:Uncharacterized protein n=1 Tax=Coccidioides immitis RMSCC 3703 TaxID=454286 RepID=A0A0J8R3M5_COCIT|nr:hypothetical protein CISG_07822 [Coccidioides immitis RMSCC 3703]
MLGTFTVNCEKALLHLQYKDLKLSVQQNPHGGPPILNVDFELKCIKKKLGMKKLYENQTPYHFGTSNTFPLPEIIFGVSLVFSSHVFLFDMLFHANAFQDDIRSMADIPQLHCQELPLPLKPEVRDYYLFCKVDVVDGQVHLQQHTPMTAGALDSQLKTMSEIHGWLNLFYSHQFQYSSGKMLDESVIMPCLFVAGNADMKQSPGFVSEAQQNIIMNHATSSTFIKYYHTQRHDSMQEIICGLDLNVELAKAMRQMSCSMDKQHPCYLGDTGREAVEQDQELQAAIRSQDHFTALSKENQKLLPKLKWW